MPSLISIPVSSMGNAARQAQGNSGAGVFSFGTSLIVCLVTVVILIFIFKNFEKIIDFIFKRRR